MQYGVPADAISVPADSAAAVAKFTISIPRESCAKAKYSSSVVPPDPSVHFYHWLEGFQNVEKVHQIAPFIGENLKKIFG